MITRVRLKNWKSHLDSDFSFQPGVNALIGIVGSGKTSILQAISFGLFGTLNPLKTRRATLGDLIMNRPQFKDAAEVQVDFSVDGKQYSVRRVVRRRRGTTEAEIREDGRLLDVNPKGVTAEVERILQMDYELFSKAVYSEQNEMDYFLRIPRGKRTEHIDRMLKVDRFEKVREGAVGLKNSIMARREERARFVQELEKEGLDKKVSKLEEEISGLRKQAAEETEKTKVLERKRQEIEKNLEDLEKRERNVSEVRMEIEGLRSGLKELEASIERKRKELEGFDPEALSKKVEDEIREKRKVLGDTRKGEEEGTKRVMSLNARIKLISDSIKELEKVGAKCPVCESEVTDEKKNVLLTVKREEEQKLREGVKSVAESLSAIREEKETLEMELKERELEKDRIALKAKELDQIREDSKRKGDYEEKIKSAEERKKALEEGFSKECLQGLRKELQGAAAKESAGLERLSALENNMREKENILKEVKERQGMLQEYRKSLETGEKMAESLGVFVQVLKATQEQLREEFVKTVNHIMQNVWENLYPYGDFGGIRLTVDDDYVLQLQGGQEWVPVDGIASGGERSMACLALRIAFSHAFIPNLKWLILDEPTHNLDAASIQNLSSILQERIGAFAEQVFLITHEERVSEGLDSVYMLDRDKGKNEPTRIMAG